MTEKRLSRATRAQATPKGYHTLNPILRVPNAAAALEFYTRVFGAREDFRREQPGRLLLAVITIGDSHLMISDAANEPDKVAGGDPRGNGLELKIYVDDVDEVFGRAIAAGAKEEEPLADHFFGERSGDVTDPFGFSWRLAQFVEDVPHDEIERRMHREAGTRSPDRTQNSTSAPVRSTTAAPSFGGAGPTAGTPLATGTASRAADG
jgi:PhnB protein